MEFPPLIDLGDDDADSSPIPTSYSQDLFHPNYGVAEFSMDDTRLRSSHFFDSSSSSDDGDAFAGESNSVDYTAKRLDYMLDFLDRRLSSNSNLHSSSDCLTDENSHTSSHRHRTRSFLPEFVGRGGGTGIFRLPVRAAVHPHRPPSLDVRPHPLRETQIGCFLRTIGGGQSQLWAGTECGLRAWNFKDMYFASEFTSVSIGDEGSAPFTESVLTSPTLCLTVDEASRVVWSGHKDGRIMCWNTTNLPNSNTNAHFSESLSWYAHRGPVLSLVMTSYGDLWSGSEGGDIKVWPWEELETSMTVTTEEGYMASLSVEKSYIDLRSQVAVNGFCNTFTWDVKYLLSDDSTAKVWSGCYFSFALWDARTKELLKVFNSDGQMENRVDISTGQDIAVDSASFSKKEKTQSSFGFFQRSRNAIMGAADAVRRVAAKGAFGEDNRRTEALVMAVDGMIWTGCTSGQLVQWDGNFNRLQDFLYHSYAVQCLCTFGQRLWVGYSSGTVQVLDLTGQPVGEWVAHSSPIISMTTGSGYVFTLANHGGVRGWNVTSPGPLDSILRSELAGKEFLYTKIENLRILTGTWNVGQGRASHDSLISWLGAAASKAAIVVVGLQEVEMGAGFLAMSAARETVGLEGTSLGQWWVDTIDETLGETSSFQLVGSRQLAGLLIAAWVRNSVRAHVGDVDAAAVPCGFGRAIGNKGAVGLRIRVYDRIMCFVNCHFAAHMEAVNRRNADFEHVYRTMSFCRPTNLFTAAAGTVRYLLLFCTLAFSIYLFWLVYRYGLPLVLSLAASSSSAVQILRGSSAVSGSSVEGIPELSDADMVIFLGDFNYRLDGISYDEARDFVSQRSFDWLKERDQLRAEMVAGNVFQGMREALVTFPPTYKFERHQSGLAGYDSGEKKRIPAWCDRILYRDNQSALASECSLECPVVSSIIQYDASMDVTDSDHKPVRCIFSVDIARVDESIRRQVFGEILSSNEIIKHTLSSQKEIPETIVSTNNIILQNQDSSILRITNKSQESDALFQIICEGQSTVNEVGQASDLHPRGSFGFPPWLEVTPAIGIIKADQIMEVVVHHEEFFTLEEFVDGVQQNSWCEITQDREVVLIVKVRGNFSTESQNHRVRIRSCCSAKTTETNDELKDSWKSHSNVLQRSDFQRLSSSCDVVDRIKSLHGP